MFIGTRVSTLAPLISLGAFLLVTLEMFDEDEAAGVDETGAGYGVEATGVALTTGVGSAT